MKRKKESENIIVENNDIKEVDMQIYICNIKLIIYRRKH